MNEMIKKKIISTISLIVLSVGCATIDESSFIKPGETPKLETSEGGLWMQMEKFEENIDLFCSLKKWCFLLKREK